jgi:phage tail sheath protein FI
MPVAPTYPGIYIEEIPSGVRTITGVATSITAFVGSAPRGPVNEPITINSFADYERRFGGLSLDSTMSYAVRSFYLNGGSQAVIVRLARMPGSGPDAAEAATIALPALISPPGELVLVAASVGGWGNNLSALVDHNTRDPSNVAQFNLTISEKGGATEKFLNVSVDPADPRYLPRVLEQGSMLVRVNKDSADQFEIGGVRPSETFTPSSPPTSPPSSLPAPVTATGGADGGPLTQAQFVGTGMSGAKQGLFALEKVDLFNLLCIPPFSPAADVTTSLLAEAVTYCRKRRAMLLVDPPAYWTNKDIAKREVMDGPYPGTNSNYAALFFPRLKQPNPLRDNQIDEFVPCGAVAGVFARTDTQRGVWKAPAGQDAVLAGVPQLSVPLTDEENGELNPLGINCLRAFPVIGRVVWGARTLEGADRLASEWKYIPVRRTALFIEESLYRGTQWVIFEPNDEPLWSQIRLNVGSFMQNMFRQGAFQGKTPREAYFVKCDKETTTQNDINLGIVNVIVGFAPLKPAEFVILKIQQIAGQLEV